MNLVVSVVNLKEFRREFRSLKNKSFAFAIKNANDSAAYFYRSIFALEWNRKLNVKKKNFIHKALRIQKSFVDTSLGIVTRPTVVYSTAPTNELLRTHIHGNPARRRPGGGRWFIRANPRRRTGRKTYTINNKWVFISFKTKKDEYWGVLKDTVNVPARVNKRKLDERLKRHHPRLLRSQLEKELRFRQQGVR